MAGCERDGIFDSINECGLWVGYAGCTGWKGIQDLGVPLSGKHGRAYRIGMKYAPFSIH